MKRNFKKLALGMAILVGVSNVGQAGIFGNIISWVGNQVTSVINTTVSTVNQVASAACGEVYMPYYMTDCQGNERNFDLRRRTYQGITWSVSEGGQIIAINGVTTSDFAVLEDLVRQQAGLPAGFPVEIRMVSFFTQKNVVNIQGGLDQSLVTTANVNGGLKATYNGTTIDVTGVNLDATANVSSSLSVYNSLTYKIDDAFGGRLAGSITVRYNGKSENVQVNTLVRGAAISACGDASASANIKIIKKPIKPIISGLNNSTVSCNASFGLSTPYQNYTTLFWKADGASLYNPQSNQVVGTYEGTYVTVSGFNSTGLKQIQVTAANACSEEGETTAIQVNVVTPTITLNLNGNPLNSSSYSPNCTQSDQGFNLSVEPWISNNSVYTWELPAGWIMENASSNIVSTSIVGGLNKYTYAGVNLRYPRIKRVSISAISGIVNLKVDKICGGQENTTKSFQLNAPKNIDIDMPASIVSCENTIAINPIINNPGTAPYNIVWSKNGIEGSFTSASVQQIGATSISNSFSALRYGNGTVSVNVTDANGCKDIATSNVSMFGGEGSDYVSGWLSGHINPNQRAEVVSKPTVVDNRDRVFVTTKINGVNQISFYDFDGSKWVLKNSGITNVLQNGNLDIKYIKTTGTNDLLFYYNANQELSVIQIENSTGLAVGSPRVINGVFPKADEYAYSITPFDGQTLEIVWKDQNSGTLYYGLLKYQITPVLFSVNLSNNQKISVSEPNVFAGSVTRFDHDIINERIVYIKGNGGVFFRKINSNTEVLEAEVKINGFLENDLVQNVTDIVSENGGNGIYFVAGGFVFYADFDKITGNYLGLYKLNTPVGVQIPSNYNSGASGYLAKNPDPLSKSLYYAGYNGSIYQIVKRDDFETSKAFEILKSTPTNFYDQASNGLVYHRGHVFYRSSNSPSQLYNLFYIDIAGVATCKPKYLRESVEFVKTFESELMDSDNGELRGQVFPNPTENQVTINVYGKENEVGTLEVFDMQGQLMKQEVYNFETQSLDLSEFATGVYIVKVSSPSVSKPISFKVTKK